ncbi:hypothetical protein ACVWYG_002303 [Pedobacter sp. UYEF25]
MKTIFNGKDLKGWTSFIKEQGVNNDPNEVFKIEDGLLHVSGEEFGYVATKIAYKNFHLSIEFKWGNNKYPPRENDKRDAGICFNVEPNNKIWPKSIECQIQEGDVGDLWLIDQVTVSVNGKKTTPRDYERVPKMKDAERKHGEWNVVEVISNSGKFQFLVNGTLVNQGDQMSILKGRILLQSEGAEVFYRNIRIQKL